MISSPFVRLLRSFRGLRPAVVGFLLVSAGLASAADNLLPQASFENWDGARPVGWGIRSPQKVERGTGPNGEATLKVTNAKALPGKSGEIFQTVKVQPQTDYILKGLVRSDAPGGALLQVKTLLDGKEHNRINSPKAGTEWRPVSVKFNSGASESVIVLLRWAQEEADLGAASEFAQLSLEEYVWTPPPFRETPPHAVATYNCLGLYWKPQGGSAKKTVGVQYRRKGDSEWKDALPLWFDATEHDEEALAHSYEYRGSIVGLEPGTTYEVKLTMEGGPEKVLEARTRSGNFPVARRVKLPDPGAKSLTITEGGTPGGYVLYEPADPDKPWDGGGTALENLKVDASYVILKGFTLRNAQRHGIVLGNVHDVVIDGCDISGWGGNRFRRPGPRSQCGHLFQRAGAGAHHRPELQSASSAQRQQFVERTTSGHQQQTPAGPAGHRLPQQQGRTRDPFQQDLFGHGSHVQRRHGRHPQLQLRRISHLRQ